MESNKVVLMLLCNATTISINASHASYVSHPDEIAKLILDAAKGKATQ